MRKITFRYITDPGHGWFKVPVKVIRANKLELKISQYSYISRNGDFVYCEEDQDGPLVIRTLTEKGITVKTFDTPCNRMARLRNLRPYRPEYIKLDVVRPRQPRSPKAPAKPKELTAALQHISAMALKSKLELESRAFRDNNDCSVRAIAAIAGISYKDAYALCAQHGRRKNKGMYTFAILSAAKSIKGITLDNIDKKFWTARKTKQTYWGPKEVIQRPTVRTLHKIFPKGMYLVFVNRHVLAYKNGTAIDWTEGRCHRIQSIYRVSYS